MLHMLPNPFSSRTRCACWLLLALGCNQTPELQPAPGGASVRVLPPLAGSLATVAGSQAVVAGQASVPVAVTAGSGARPAASGGAGSVAGVAGRNAMAGASGGRAGMGASGMAFAAGMGAAAGAGSIPLSPDGSAGALSQLAQYLSMPRAQRPKLDDQPFATVPLTKADAEQARDMLWKEFAAWVKSTRMGEMGATESRAATLQVDGHSMRYYVAARGSNPPTGRSLFISMHGGGNAGASTNDEQWNNQITLVDGYKPVDALWVAPRAPSNEWNMWFTPDVDILFEHLVTNMIVFEGIDPNKVYINGYSAGGDAVYQLGPRMADHWAGAAMSAGHPNDASPLNLRNVPFAIHVGGDDTAYDRNLKAQEWGKMLESLHAADMGGYINQWQVHAGLPHWMNMEDAVAIPFVQKYTRNPLPDRVLWRQVNVTQARFYWLAVDQANRKQGTQVTASFTAGNVSLSEIMGLHKLSVRFTDAMMDLDKPVRVELSGRELFSGSVPRTIGVMSRTLEDRGDPALVFSGEVSVSLD